MNYIKIYNEIIDRAKSRILEPHIYTEKHHILPKSMGGSNSIKNTVILTAKEHYLCHFLLTRIYPNNLKMIRAFWMICNGSKKDRPNTNSKMYQIAKEEFSAIMKGKAFFKGKKHSEESNRKNSEAHKGKTSWIGRKHKEESRIKMSNSALGRKQSEEVKRRISQSKLGVKYTQEHRNNISKAKQGINNPMFGKKWKLINGKRTYYE